MNLPGLKHHWFASAILAAALWLTAPWVQAKAPNLEWQLVESHAHDPEDFTQGLVWSDGRLFESTGNYGSSRLIEKDLKTGKALHQTQLSDKEFAEGLAVHKGELWQLTWREGVAHVYDLALKPLRSLRYRGEGWGLTSDGKQLIVSNGSPTLYFLDTETLAVTRQLLVRDGEQPVFRLNELEWIDGAIYANVWHSQRVARIDPNTGQVNGWLDFSPLVKTVGPLHSEAVLNGLAWNAHSRQLLVTGKNWPRLFVVRLMPSKR